jgi:hypothetical protein
VRLLLAAVVLAAAPAAPVPALSATALPGFRSPTGNIRCLYVPGVRPVGGVRPVILLCSLARADYAKTLQARCMRPDGSGVDWHGFELGARSRGRVTCSGGILYDPGMERPTYPALAYGSTWRHGPFACTSRITGVTCRSRAGHGLFVARQSWRVW